MPSVQMHICGIGHIGADLHSWRGSRYHWSAVGILDFYWQLPRQFSEPRNWPLMICASGQVPRQHMKYHKGHAAASTIVYSSGVSVFKGKTLSSSSFGIHTDTQLLTYFRISCLLQFREVARRSVDFCSC